MSGFAGACGRMRAGGKSSASSVSAGALFVDVAGGLVAGAGLGFAAAASATFGADRGAGCAAGADSGAGWGSAAATGASTRAGSCEGGTETVAAGEGVGAAATGGACGAGCGSGAGFAGRTGSWVGFGDSPRARCSAAFNANSVTAVRGCSWYTTHPTQPVATSISAPTTRQNHSLPCAGSTARTSSG